MSWAVPKEHARRAKAYAAAEKRRKAASKPKKHKGGYHR